MNKIGENISRRRKELNMTQRILAEKLDISDKTISRWETGNQIPDASMIPEIARVLEMSINELYGIEDSQKGSVEETPRIEYGKVMAFKVAVLISLFICFASVLVIRINYTFLDVKYIIFLCGVVILFLSEMVFYGFSKRKPMKKLYEQMNFQWFGLAMLMVDAFIVIGMPRVLKEIWYGIKDFYSYKGIVTTIILNFLMLIGSLLYRKYLRKKGFEIQKGTMRIVILLGILGIIFSGAYVAAIHLQPIYAFTDKFGTKLWWEDFTEQAAGVIFIAMQAVNYFILLMTWKEKQISTKKIKYSLLGIGAVAIVSIVVCFGGYFKNSLYNKVARPMAENGERAVVSSVKIGIDFGDNSYIYFDLRETENVEQVLEMLRDVKVKKGQWASESSVNNKMEIGNKYLIVMSGNVQEDTYLETILFQDAAHVAYQGEIYRIQNEVDFNALYKLALSEYEGQNKEFYKGMLRK